MQTASVKPSMKKLILSLAATFLCVSPAIIAPASATPYTWRPSSETAETLSQRFSPPANFVRRTAQPQSFAHWLRNLPLKPVGTPVLLHTGLRKWRQDAHAAIIDIDVGKRDLQQCADAIMRLRAEWLWGTGQRARIAFNYTGGGRVPYLRWAKGERPSETGKSWRRRGKRNDSYAGFKKYMVQVFAYAGTYSLERELKPVNRNEIKIGDVFIKGGFPGHAVLVADMTVNPDSGEKKFLLLQSYMPAQDIHVLKNPRSPDGSPWYPATFDGALVTPEWTFPKGSLRRWPN